MKITVTLTFETMYCEDDGTIYAMDHTMDHSFLAHSNNAQNLALEVHKYFTNLHGAVETKLQDKKAPFNTYACLIQPKAPDVRS